MTQNEKYVQRLAKAGINRCLHMKEIDYETERLMLELVRKELVFKTANHRISDEVLVLVDNFYLSLKTLDEKFKDKKDLIY